MKVILLASAVTAAAWLMYKTTWYFRQLHINRVVGVGPTSTGEVLAFWCLRRVIALSAGDDFDPDKVPVLYRISEAILRLLKVEERRWAFTDKENRNQTFEWWSTGRVLMGAVHFGPVQSYSVVIPLRGGTQQDVNNFIRDHLDPKLIRIER